VQQNAGQMMAAGMQSVQLAVQHVRQPRQRMPVERIILRERPDHSFERQAANDFRIFINVLLVIIVNKSVPQRLAKNHPDGGGEKKTHTREDRLFIFVDYRGAGLLFGRTGGWRSSRF